MTRNVTTGLQSAWLSNKAKQICMHPTHPQASSSQLAYSFYALPSISEVHLMDRRIAYRLKFNLIPESVYILNLSCNHIKYLH